MLEIDLESVPFISVIIPTFNRADFLREALASLAAQKFKDFETIVVDDGSEEDIEAVARSCGFPVQYLSLRNSGQGVARNAGVGAARGDYITFLDSDDLWFPWTLEAFAGAIRDTGVPAWVMGNAKEFRSPQELQETHWTSAKYEKHRDYLASAVTDAWIPGCGVAVRRKAFEMAGGFTERRINGEDSDLWIRLGEAPGFVHLRSPHTLAYRTHAGSAVTNVERLWDGMQHLVAQENGGIYPGGQRRRLERWRILSRHTRAASRSLLSAGWNQEAMKLYRQTFRWNFRLARWKYLAGFWAQFWQNAGRFSAPTVGASYRPAK